MLLNLPKQNSAKNEILGSLTYPLTIWLYNFSLVSTIAKLDFSQDCN
jgi:hypothetical protein